VYAASHEEEQDRAGTAGGTYRSYRMLAGPRNLGQRHLSRSAFGFSRMGRAAAQRMLGVCEVCLTSRWVIMPSSMPSVLRWLVQAPSYGPGLSFVLIRTGVVICEVA
jgi:hypothetical protein